MDKIETRADAIDWQGMRDTVDEKLRYLEAVWRSTEKQGPPEAHAKLVNDMYFPIVRMVAEFCECVKVGEPEDDVGGDS